MKRAISLLIVLIMIVVVTACTGGGIGSDIFEKTYGWKDFIDGGLPGADLDSADDEYSTLVGYQEPIETEDIITDDDGIQYVKNRINVTFASNTSGQEISDIIKAADADVIGYIAGMSMYQIRISEEETQADLMQVITRLEENDAVLVAMRDEVIVDFTDDPSDPWKVSFVTEDVVWDEDNPDGSNWNIEAIQGLSAWQYKDRMQSVKVGVVDSGFDLSHEDLQIREENVLDNHKLFKNTKHGTQVCGVIGATADNGKGITGVAPNAELYVINNVDSFGMKLCIKWLVMIKKVKIINVSQGYTNPKKNEREQGWLDNANEYETLFIERLAEHNDFLIICASGNIEMDTKWQGLFSAIEKDEAKKHILTVSSMAIDKGKLIPGNNTAYGVNVDLFAPGDNVLSTFPNNKYMYAPAHASSIAAPHATGVAAMVLGVNPNLTCSEVRDIILNSATEKLPYHNQNIKILNAKSAVESAIETIGQADGQQLLSSNIKVNAKYIEFNNQNIYVNLVYPEISGMQDSVFEESINTQIANEMDSLAHEAENVNLKAGYGVGSFYLQSYFTVERNDEDFLSVRLQIFNHTDEDYLNYSRYVNITNTKPCEKLELADIFLNGSDYVPMLNGKIEALIAEEYWSEEYYFNSITDGQGFYLTNASLGVVFPSKEIASFEYYEPEFEIPLAELSEILRPDLNEIDLGKMKLRIGGYTDDSWENHEFYGIRKVEDGYYMLSKVQEYAKLSFEDFERMASGEIVDTVAGTLQYDGEDDEGRFYFSNPDDMGIYYYIGDIPNPGKSEMLYWEYEYPVSYTVEEREFFVPDNAYVYSPDHLHGHYFQKSFEDYINYGGSYEGYWTGRIFAWVSGDMILRLEEEYES